MIKILNTIVTIYKEIKGDTFINASKFLIGTGVTLTGCSGIGFGLNLFLKTSDLIVHLDFTLNDTLLFLVILGTIFILVGFVLMLTRFRNISNKSILLYAPFFNNLSDKPPIDVIPFKDRYRINPVVLKKIDSYNTNEIKEKYLYHSNIIGDRVDFHGIDKVYVAALASVPYLYLLGTMFKDGHSKIINLDYKRTQQKWSQLDLLGNSVELISNDLTSNDFDEVTVCIEFTFPISIESLPNNLDRNIVKLSLSSGFNYESLQCRDVQNDILMQIQHKLCVLAQKYNKLHLFIAAQSSVIFNLGSLYQNNAMSKIVIYNYDSNEKSYPWGIEYTNEYINIVHNSDDIVDV